MQILNGTVRGVSIHSLIANVMCAGTVHIVVVASLREVKIDKMNDDVGMKGWYIVKYEK